MDDSPAGRASLTAAVPADPVDTAAEPFSSLVPAIIGAALMMQTLNATVLANALPTMARSLGKDPVHLNTATTVYLLASAVFLPVSGWAADRFGAKKVFLFAIVGYASACAGCGLAQSLPQLLLARFCAGAAGAMMGPVGRLVLLRSTAKSNLVRAMSVLTMPALLGPVLGPPIGGFIVTYGSWRWIFFFNLPIAVLGVVLVTRFIPNVREQGVRPLDWIGLILTGVGMAGVVYGFENLGRSAFPPWAVAAMMVGGAGCLALYVRHARRTEHAILDLGLLKIHTFTASVLLTGGFFRSLQFTALNGVAYADIDPSRMSRASTMSTMGQQLSQSMGIGLAATLLRLMMAGAHAHDLSAATIAPAFVAIGFVALISTLFFLSLPANAGASLHSGRPSGPEPFRPGRVGR